MRPLPNRGTLGGQAAVIDRDSKHGIELRLSAQRALWGHVPPSLRAVSLERRADVIYFRAVFEPNAREADRELLSCAAAEVIADFTAPVTIEEEFVHLSPPARPAHLQHLVYLRSEEGPASQDSPERESGNSDATQPAHVRDLFFLNVDLDIEADGDLALLTQALEPHAYALERSPGRASLELAEPARATTPEPLILEFVGIVQALPLKAREVWDRAEKRVFDIGIQSGRRPFQETYRLGSETLRAVAEIGADIAVTVYSLSADDASH
jgi:hypothetical protein